MVSLSKELSLHRLKYSSLIDCRQVALFPAHSKVTAGIRAIPYCRRTMIYARRSQFCRYKPCGWSIRCRFVRPSNSRIADRSSHASIMSWSVMVANRSKLKIDQRLIKRRRSNFPFVPSHFNSQPFTVFFNPFSFYLGWFFIVRFPK